MSINTHAWSAEQGDLHKLAKYQSESKNPTVAILGAWIFPSVGHAYAGDWFRGAPFLAINVGLPIAMIASGGSALLTTSYLITRIWENVDAYSTAEESNHKLALALNNESTILVVKEGRPGDSYSERSIGALERKYDKKFERLFKVLKIKKEDL